MPKTGAMLLREAREAAGLSQKQLAIRLECISESTVKRWEYGESHPESADIERIGEILGDPTLWHRWMEATDEAYAKRYSVSEKLTMPSSIVKVRHAMEDIASLQGAIERDALDGSLEDERLKREYSARIKNGVASLLWALQQLMGVDEL